MKSLRFFIAIAAGVVTLTGCLLPETVENRIRYIDQNTPPQITVIWRNISSDAKNDKELQEDFAELIKEVDSTNTDVFVGFKKDLMIRERQVYIEGGKLNMRISGIPPTGQFEDLASNGERMLVLDMEEAGRVETNGTLLKTEENYIIVWPESMKEISWINRLIPGESNEDLKRWKQNRPTLIKMFEAYQQQRRVK